MISILVAISMIIEQINGRNFFSIFGGVPEFTYVRVGRLRSQGAFSHPILAGSFGAAMMPLVWGMWWKKDQKKLPVMIWAIAATVITITSASSGPLLSYIMGIVGLIMWLLRKHLRIIRLGLIFSLICLHFVMTGPVWALLWRINIIGGSGGYHRYWLIDETIRRFREWWLVGVQSTAHWGWGLQDVTNMYVSQAVNGGFISLILFILIVVFSYRALGKSINSLNNQIHLQKLNWSIGVSLFTHLISFIGVSYFDQIIFMYFITIAIIVTISKQKVISEVAK
jgi:hypothetical protein